MYADLDAKFHTKKTWNKLKKDFVLIFTILFIFVLKKPTLH